MHAFQTKRASLRPPRRVPMATQKLRPTCARRRPLQRTNAGSIAGAGKGGLLCHGRMANNRYVPKTTVANALDADVQRFARTIQQQLPKLQTRYARELRKAGFDALRVAALSRISPLAAAQTV